MKMNLLFKKKSSLVGVTEQIMDSFFFYLLESFVFFQWKTVFWQVNSLVFAWGSSGF